MRAFCFLVQLHAKTPRKVSSFFDLTENRMKNPKSFSFLHVIQIKTKCERSSFEQYGKIMSNRLFFSNIFWMHNLAMKQIHSSSHWKMVRSKIAFIETVYYLQLWTNFICYFRWRKAISRGDAWSKFEPKLFKFKNSTALCHRIRLVTEILK